MIGIIFELTEYVFFPAQERKTAKTDSQTIMLAEPTFTANDLRIGRVK